MGVFIFKYECTDGANFNAFSALAAGRLANRLILEGGDHPLKTPSGKAYASDAQLLLAYPHAFAAENTFVRIVRKEGTAFVDGEVSFELSEAFCYEFYAKMFGNFLELTGSIFLTVTAIYGVACQNELSGGACKP